MIRIEAHNFGQYATLSTNLESKSLPHGAGKTTLVNAYYFALSGRTLHGFEPHKKGMTDDQRTEVTLFFNNSFAIRRVKPKKGDSYIVYNPGGRLVTQADLIYRLAETGLDITFMCACANVNVLTDPSLTADDLRKLLTVTGTLEGDEIKALKREREAYVKGRAAAESYAVSNVTIPSQPFEPLTESEVRYKDSYVDAVKTYNTGLHTVCECCGQDLPESIRESREDAYKAAIRFIEKGKEEYTRILLKQGDYLTREQQIADAKRLIESAKDAREDVKRYDKLIAEVTEKIRLASEMSDKTWLPDGVTIVTERVAKNGNVTPTCVLTYDGIPLKSVNRAKRIELCVRLLDNARIKKGMCAVPIVIDNAESILTGTEDIDNVIYLRAKK